MFQYIPHLLYLYTYIVKAREREKAIEMRLKYQLGYGAIRKKLQVSKGTLSRWLKNLPLSDERILELRRKSWTKGEAKREQFRKSMRAKREILERVIYEQQKMLVACVSEDALFVAGLMLYAAEGEKTSTADISFTNTDHALVVFFSKWVVRFLGLPKSKFRIQLHLYENMNIPAEEAFWLRSLGFTKGQLWKSQVKALRPRSFSYRDGSRHGTCKLYIGSVPAKGKLMLSIKAFFDTHKRLQA